jgi:sterol desaturase/sphingolipid hydroxylase (fatty acid hydroxylase superfamily)
VLILTLADYANVSPLFDLLFGTYRCPAQEPDAVGLSEPFPKGYLRQLLQPFLRR